MMMIIIIIVIKTIMPIVERIISLLRKTCTCLKEFFRWPNLMSFHKFSQMKSWTYVGLLQEKAVVEGGPWDEKLENDEANFEKGTRMNPSRRKRMAGN